MEGICFMFAAVSKCFLQFIKNDINKIKFSLVGALYVFILRGCNSHLNVSKNFCNSSLKLETCLDYIHHSFDFLLPH